MTQSMTAFARTTDQGKWGSATWDIRSVNHRYLDCNFRMPESLRHLEHKLREIAHKKLGRGKIDCSLKFQPGEATKLELNLNTNLIKQLAKASDEVGKIFKTPSAKVNPLHVLSWNDVLQINNSDSQKNSQKVVKLFEQALNELIKVRAQEGASLKQLIAQRLDAILSETQKLKKHLPSIIKTHRERIMQNLAKISGEHDSNRLEQEMVYYAQKIDIAEELDRLQMHIKETKKILQKTGPVGKRLDFMMQELNREANTVASKAVEKNTTHTAVELKVLIEQMREQIQNIE